MLLISHYLQGWSPDTSQPSSARSWSERLQPASPAVPLLGGQHSALVLQHREQEVPALLVSGVSSLLSSAVVS